MPQQREALLALGADLPRVWDHPAAGNESVRISLYVFDKGQMPLKNGNEVVVEKFEYLP